MSTFEFPKGRKSMDLSFSVNLNLKPMAQCAFNKVVQGRDCLFSGSKFLSNNVDKVNKFLFGNVGKICFTQSAIGTLAVSYFGLGLFPTVVCSGILSSAISNCKEDGVNIDDIHEDAVDQLIGKYPNYETSDALIEERGDELAEIKANLKSTAEAEAKFYDLAQTNLVMTVASKLIFDSNTLGLSTLALTSTLRSLACVSKQKID